MGSPEMAQKNMQLPSLLKGMTTQFLGYDSLSAEGEVIGIVAAGKGELLTEVDTDTAEKELYLVLDRSPFYAEQGGQVGDTGLINAPEGSALVKDTLPGPDGQILHLLEIREGIIRVGEKVRAIVDQKRREDIARHHTATHLLHRALRDSLGEHVHQAGSLVTSDRLRFDFSHFAPLEARDLVKLEETINSFLLKNFPVQTTYTNLEQAMEKGALALFDEKYGEKVRLVEVDDYSLELCGGTHVRSTGEIGVFKIISEGSVGAGIRRIEALAGERAYRYLADRDQILKGISDQVKVPAGKVAEKLAEMLESQKELQRRIKQLSQKLSQHDLDHILEKVDSSLGIPILAAQVEAESMEVLREYLDKLRDKLESGIIMLGSANNEKVYLVAAITQDLVKKGFHAGRLIGEIAKITGGGGGGRPDMAQAGGKDPRKLQQALSRVLPLVEEQQKR